MSRKLLLVATILAPINAFGQTVGSGSAGGLNYSTLTSPDGCSASSPCQIVTYLHYLGGEGNVNSDIQTYFNNSQFWSANPHTIIVAPMVNGSSDTNNWGGVQEGMSSNMQAAIAAVKQVEASVPTNPNTVAVTGGSMGGIGTEAAMVEAGPKGTVQPGVFASGLAYDGALYNSDAQAAQTALCGVPMTIVHGSADTTVSPGPDQSLASSLSSCSGFSYVQVQGATHGTWNTADWQGYNAPALIDQTISAARSGAGTSPSTSAPSTLMAALPSATPISAAITPAQTISTTPSTVSGGSGQAMPDAAAIADAAANGIQLSPLDSTNQPAVNASVGATSPGTTPTGATSTGTSSPMKILKPGSGSITDAQGNKWRINRKGAVTKNGKAIPGGGGTAELTISNGVVYGLDDGTSPSPSPNGWFTLDGAGQNWSTSQAPTDTSTTVPATASTSTVPTTASISPQATTPPPVSTQSLQQQQTSATTASVCTSTSPSGTPSGTATGAFQTVSGQIIGPDGKPFIARGIAVNSGEVSDILNGKVTAMFPGLNFVRLASTVSDTPASLAATVDYLTSRGIVVEIEDHPDAGGGQDTWAMEPGDVPWYGQMAAAFKNNPYVWFGSFNEPNPANITAWQKATYDAIRGAGSNSPILMEANGWSEGGNPVFLSGYDKSAYASMTNIVWDLHFYGWLTGMSTDPQVNKTYLAAAIAQLQQTPSASGSTPVIIGEYGNSSGNDQVDPNGMLAVDTVINSGVGSAAWNWAQYPVDNLRTGDVLSEFGQHVALFVGGQPPQPCANVTAGSPPTAPAVTTTAANISAPALPSTATDITAPTLPNNPMSVDQVAALAAGG